VLSIYNPAVSYQGQKKFDCGNTVMNAFVQKSLKPQVTKNLSVAYVLTDKANDNRFVGFYTIAQHMVDVSLLSAMQLGSLPRKIPCTRLIMLGVDKRYQRQQLGLRLMKHALQLTRSVSAQIGSFGMYLDADAEAVAFYQRLGFALLEGNQSPQPSPMFLPLSAMV
jgi:GNAT superfamily N-acetyltransferase